MTVAGIAVIAVGLAIDVAYHALDRGAELSAPCCGPGFVGHVVTLAGMVISLVGVLLFATRTSREARRSNGRRG